MKIRIEDDLVEFTPISGIGWYARFDKIYLPIVFFAITVNNDGESYAHAVINMGGGPSTEVCSNMDGFMGCEYFPLSTPPKAGD
jgi:hypothetical protein